jgi:hydrogenase maturation protease
MLVAFRAREEVIAMETSNDRSEIVVAGFGSPHGDDQAGWKVIARLAQRPQLPARLVPIREGTQLIYELDGCRKLILIDACRSNGQRGTISRFCWPDLQIHQRHNHSTHGMGLCNALELAERLGRMPSDVEVFGIEIGDNRDTVGAMSMDVSRAVSELEAIIHAELCETIHA